ncbi:MAG: 50S ribosomal protein L1 [Methanomicrobiales archaeon]|nr:50S ribosomal protein L1 [Methanomicrobiales archaeon]
MVEFEKIVEAVNSALKDAPKRNFNESVDLTINLKNIDLSNPKNRIDEVILLPNGTGGANRIAVFGKGDIVTRAKDAGADLVLGPQDIERLAGEPREARRLANQYRFFLADTGVMSLIGKSLGQRLGPRGKMPTPIPPNTDIQPIVDRLRKSVKIRTKDRRTFHTKVGVAGMEPVKIAQNIDAVLKRVESVLEQGSANIRSVYVKTTMGPAVRVI